MVATSPASPVGEARSASERAEVWEGEYTCGQGVTALTLHLTRRPDTSLEAVFMFRASERNPGVPSGSYTLVGEMRGRSFELAPAEWLDRPDGYVMVGMVGEIDGAGTSMQGRITESSCGSFQLQRAPAR